MATCKYHPDRPGVGVCMRCRAVICAACSTRLDGINHCHVCLKEMGKTAKRRTRSKVLASIAALLVLVLAWAFFFGVFWQLQGRLAP